MIACVVLSDPVAAVPVATSLVVCAVLAAPLFVGVTLTVVVVDSVAFAGLVVGCVTLTGSLFDPVTVTALLLFIVVLIGPEVSCVVLPVTIAWLGVIVEKPMVGVVARPLVTVVTPPVAVVGLRVETKGDVPTMTVVAGSVLFPSVVIPVALLVVVTGVEDVEKLEALLVGEPLSVTLTVATLAVEIVAVGGEVVPILLVDTDGVVPFTSEDVTDSVLLVT